MKPRLLDLFCGAGGAAVGYHRAGFEVVGVDVKPQLHYPFSFRQADAFDLMRELLEWGQPFPEFDAIHASPPCQRYAGITRVAGDQSTHPDLIAPTRDLLAATGLPYVIENVPDARGELINPLLLCGSMFDLDVRRHRYFETNWPLDPPMWPCRHKLWARDRFQTHDKRGRGRGSVVQVVGGPAHGPGEARLRERAMGIGWMNWRELSQAIPPAYTELIGHQLMQHVLSPRIGTAQSAC